MKKLWQTLKTLKTADLKEMFLTFKAYQSTLKKTNRKTLTEQLQTAVQNNDLETVTTLTRYQHIPFIKKPNIQINHSQLIFTALENKSFEVAHTLIQKGIITPELRDKPFTQALLSGDSKTVMMLNKNDKYLTQFSHKYLNLAAKTGHLDLIKTLAAKFASDPYCLHSMLQSATYAKQMETVNYLKNDCGQKYTSYDARILEHFAAIGDLDMSIFLMDSGVSPLANYGDPLNKAKTAGHHDVWLKMREYAYKGKAPVCHWSLSDRNTVLYSQYDQITDTSIKYCFNFKTEILTTSFSDPVANKPPALLKEEFNKIKGGEKKLLATAQNQLQQHLTQLKK